MDACPQPCHQSAEPRRPWCQTHQTQEPFWSQEGMRVGEDLRDIGSRKEVRDVGRDKAIIGTRCCLESKGPSVCQTCTRLPKRASRAWARRIIVGLLSTAA